MKENTAWKAITDKPSHEWQHALLTKLQLGSNSAPLHCEITINATMRGNDLALGSKTSGSLDLLAHALPISLNDAFNRSGTLGLTKAITLHIIASTLEDYAKQAIGELVHQDSIINIGTETVASADPVLLKKLEKIKGESKEE